MPDEILNVGEAAEALGVDRTTLWRMHGLDLGIPNATALCSRTHSEEGEREQGIDG